jgi:hypothetical protein
VIRSSPSGLGQQQVYLLLFTGAADLAVCRLLLEAAALLAAVSGE